MIRLAARRLPSATAQALRAYQAEVDGSGDYATCVATAKRLFSARNTKTNQVFSVVRKELFKLCSGIIRCCYCEDSAADEIEHLRPKDLYPEAVFNWANYVYACGPCNGPKNNKFAVAKRTTGELFIVTRPSGAPIVKPRVGVPALIDPRKEDPFEFFVLDVLDTFRLEPLETLDQVAQTRAAYTLELLRLNERESLRAARRNAYGTYLARLEQYCNRKDEGAAAPILKGLAKDLVQTPHRMVWQAMQRYRGAVPELNPLFTQAPEALRW